MKKKIYDFMYNHFPELWFALKFKVENEYQHYVYSRDDITPYGDTRKKYQTLAPVFSTLVRGRSFLEIGCDTGFYPLMASLGGARRSVGVDRNTHALTKARQAAVRLGLEEVEFLERRIPNLDLSEPFDTVLFISIIHYMFSDKEGNRPLFSDMNDLVAFLSAHTGRHLLIEFVYPEDPYVSRLVVREMVESGAYGEAAFLEALSNHFQQVHDLGGTHLATRRLFLAGREDIPPLLNPIKIVAAHSQTRGL